MLFGGFPAAVCLTRGVSSVHVSVSVVFDVSLPAWAGPVSYGTFPSLGISYPSCPDALSFLMASLCRLPNSQSCLLFLLPPRPECGRRWGHDQSSVKSGEGWTPPPRFAPWSTARGDLYLSGHRWPRCQHVDHRPSKLWAQTKEHERFWSQNLRPSEFEVWSTRVKWKKTTSAVGTVVVWTITVLTQHLAVRYFLTALVLLFEIMSKTVWAV